MRVSDASAVLNRPEEYRRMAQVETCLWWYRALHHLVAGALAKHGRGQDARIVDAGCGTGGLLMFLQARGYRNISGFDISPEAVAICGQRGLPVQSGDLLHLDQVVEPGIADVISSNDTLYFFTAAGRERILRLCCRALTPKGLLILNLPALRAFRGVHDLSVGIGHRFSGPEVRAMIAACGLSIVQMRYWPFFLSPIIYVNRLTQRVRLRYIRDLQVRSDIDHLPVPLSRLLEIATRMENAILPWKPFGSSLFVVAQKKM